MPYYVKGTDTELQGTLETLSGVAVVLGRDADGDPEYAGETKIWWDEQRTVYRDGERVWICENGESHPESAIEWRDDDEEARP